jgi:hypothetical protein
LARVDCPEWFFRGRREKAIEEAMGLSTVQSDAP